MTALLGRRNTPAATPGEPGESARLLDALWAHTTREDAVEHIRVRPEGARVGIVMFVRAASLPIAEKSASGVLDRAGRMSRAVSENYVLPDFPGGPG